MVIVQGQTCPNPISLMGQEAGICYGSDTRYKEKNYNRGIDCFNSGHGSG